MHPLTLQSKHSIFQVVYKPKNSSSEINDYYCVTVISFSWCRPHALLLRRQLYILSTVHAIVIERVEAVALVYVTHTNAHMHTCTHHRYTCTRMHTHTRAHTHTHTHTHTHIHKHSHTHQHTHIPTLNTKAISRNQACANLQPVSAWFEKN